MPDTQETLVIEECAPLDAVWAERLQAIIDTTAEPQFLLQPSDGVFNREKARVLADPAYEPDLTPDLVEVAVLEAKRDQLASLYAEIEQQTSLPAEVREAYLACIRENWVNAVMVLAAVSGDRELFAACNEYIYGRPDPAIFAATVDWFREHAAGHLHSANHTLQGAAIAVLQALPDRGGNRELLIPDPVTFAKVRERHRGFYALLFAGVDWSDDFIDRPTGDPILERVRTNIQADEYAIVDGPSTWRVSRVDHAFVRPSHYRMSRPRFAGLVAHELGTHGLGYINGARQAVRLLGIGPAGSDRCEGPAVIREQIACETFDHFAQFSRWYEIMRRHLALSLATEASRSFHEVFAIINTIDQLLELEKSPDDMEGARQRAADRTWNLLSRVLKGGGAYLKDIVYLEASVDCWRQADGDPNLINLASLGILDVTNPNHRALLTIADHLPVLVN